MILKNGPCMSIRLTDILPTLPLMLENTNLIRSKILYTIYSGKVRHGNIRYISMIRFNIVVM